MVIVPVIAAFTVAGSAHDDVSTFHGPVDGAGADPPPEVGNGAMLELGVVGPIARSRVVVGAELAVLVHAEVSRAAMTAAATIDVWVRPRRGSLDRAPRCGAMAVLVRCSIAAMTVQRMATRLSSSRPDVAVEGDVPFHANCCEAGDVDNELGLTADDDLVRKPAPDQTVEAIEADLSGAGPTVLPWWQSRLNMILLVVGVLVLAAGGGFVLGERHATPDPTTSDIGFLQDMRTHHEQAVEMSLIYISKTGTNPTTGLIAREIAFSQAAEIGRMIQLLRTYEQPEANETGTAMAWMNEAVPEDRMPGLASDADMGKLNAATGADADTLFMTLMIAHHQGGIHMAQYATAHSGTSEVRALAASMVSSEQEEIVEMQGLLTSK